MTNRRRRRRQPAATDAVVAGHLCLDFIPTMEQRPGELDSWLRPGKLVRVGPAVTATGGVVSNAGLALRRLGVATRLMGKVGNDLIGRAILDGLRRVDPAATEGLRVSPTEAGSYTIVLSPPGLDRMFLHYPATNDTFGAADVAYHRLRGARLFHFGYPPLMRRMYQDGGRELAAIFRRVKQCGLTTALDMSMPDPESDAGRADWPAILKRTLPFVDVYLPSLQETLLMLDRPRFERLTRRDGPDGILRQADGTLLRAMADQLLSMGVAIAALKVGEQGLYVRTAGDASRFTAMGPCAPSHVPAWLNRELLSPCFRVRVVGTTGSGDSTIAGFLAGLLRGLPLEETMTVAVGVGAHCCEQADATSGIPTWAALRKRIRSGWNRLPVTMALPGWRHDRKQGIWIGPEDNCR